MTHTQRFFSIIIPTYNRPGQLTACLQSLTCLSYPRDCFEVIVVDDGSMVTPEAVIAPFREQLAVTLLWEPNTGPATARNLGAMKARGTFLAFTDDDCQPTSDWLQALAGRFAEDQDCMIGGRTINALPDNLYSKASQLLIDYLYAYYNVDPDRARFFTSNNLAVAAERFRAIRGFDTTFPWSAAEDREFCDRWLTQGYHMRYVPEAIVHHAHVLTYQKFMRQHFWYGRGAFAFHRIRASRGTGRMKVEPMAFYRDLLRYAFLHERGVKGLLLGVLLIGTQVANISGFVWERLNEKRGQ
jgi:glycosyltransferase involved in cell wall biosynthesis